MMERRAGRDRPRLYLFLWLSFFFLSVLLFSFGGTRMEGIGEPCYDQLCRSRTG